MNSPHWRARARALRIWGRSVKAAVAAGLAVAMGSAALADDMGIFAMFNHQSTVLVDSYTILHLLRVHRHKRTGEPTAH